jgi:ABC-type multidrug transport system fused ATPase/permease subunit
VSPPLLAPGRRRAFAGLAALSALEAAALAGSAAAGQTAIAALSAGAPADGPLLWLGAAAAGSVLTVWGRAAAAEAFGMAYVNDVREDLARHALESAQHGRRTRIGTVTARMAGDLPALKHWVSLGLSDATAAFAAGIAGAAVLIVGAPGAGPAAAAAMLLVLALWLWACAGPLRRAWAAVRAERGRVSALVGDMVLASRAICAFGAQARELRRLRKRAARLRAASVSQRAQAALLLAPSALMLPIALTLAAAAPALDLAAPADAAGWAGYLFGAGLFAGAAAGLCRALDAWLAFAVASDRIERLTLSDASPAAATETAPAPPAARARRATPGPVSLVLDGAHHIAEPGACLILDAAAAAAAVSCLLEPASKARLGDTALADLPAAARTRLIAVACPEVPLLRASLWRNLSPRRRDAPKAELTRALALAGVDPALWPHGAVVDPDADAGQDRAQARLRIARAVAARPAVIVIAEPALAADPDLPALARAIAEDSGAAVLCGAIAGAVSAAA